MQQNLNEEKVYIGHLQNVWAILGTTQRSQIR